MHPNSVSQDQGQEGVSLLSVTCASYEKDDIDDTLDASVNMISCDQAKVNHYDSIGHILRHILHKNELTGKAPLARKVLLSHINGNNARWDILPDRFKGPLAFSWSNGL